MTKIWPFQLEEKIILLAILREERLSPVLFSLWGISDDEDKLAILLCLRLMVMLILFDFFKSCKPSQRLYIHVIRQECTSACQCVSVSQKNPLRQVMWVSNPLEGYWIPSSAVHSLSALSKTLTGPRARACQARRQSDGEPTPWCAGPWLSPTHCHWGCTLRGLRSLQHNPDVHYWVCGCVQVCVRRLGVWECANKGSM